MNNKRMAVTITYGVLAAVVGSVAQLQGAGDELSLDQAYALLWERRTRTEQAGLTIRNSGEPQSEAQLWLDAFPDYSENASHALVLAEAFWSISPSRSRRFAKLVIDAYPNDTMARFQWALQLYRLGEFPKAAQYCNKESNSETVDPRRVLILAQALLLRQETIGAAVEEWSRLRKADNWRDLILSGRKFLNSGVYPELRRIEYIEAIASKDRTAACKLLQLYLAWGKSPAFARVNGAGILRDLPLVEKSFGENADVSRLYRGFAASLTNDRKERLEAYQWLVRAPWANWRDQDHQPLVLGLLQLADEEDFPIPDGTLDEIELNVVGLWEQCELKTERQVLVDVILSSQRHRDPENSLNSLRKLRVLGSPRLAVAEIMIAYRSGSIYHSTESGKELAAQFSDQEDVRAAFTIGKVILRDSTTKSEVADAIRIHLRKSIFVANEERWLFATDRLFRAIAESE